MTVRQPVEVPQDDLSLQGISRQRALESVTLVRKETCI